MKLSYRNIEMLLNTDKNRVSRSLSYTGLFIGVLLFLGSLQMFININQLLKGRNPRKDGFDYISITRLITNENMGRDNSFTAAELEDLKKHPAVVDAAPLIGNKFLIKATGGSALPFSSDLFLEAIDKSFIDSVPPSFIWQPGQTRIPIIVSSEYLELYNAVFAPSRDLPQVSEKTMGMVVINLECYTSSGIVTLTGSVVGLSDRISTVLVPDNFLRWANENFAGTTNMSPTRIYIKTQDANDPSLLTYIKEKGYRVNTDKTKFGRIKQVLQSIVSALGIFGVLVIVLALLLFSFYLKLMIARSRENLQLLLLLGYSPRWLSKSVARKWLPVYLIIILAALVGTFILHYAFIELSIAESAAISMLPHWSVLAAAVLLGLLSMYSNYKLVKKELYRIA
jgi:hypothetical protein